MDTDRQYGSYNGRPYDAEERRRGEEGPPRRAPPLRRDRYDLDDRGDGDDDGRLRNDELHLRDDDDKARVVELV